MRRARNGAPGSLCSGSDVMAGILHDLGQDLRDDEFGGRSRGG